MLGGVAVLINECLLSRLSGFRLWGRRAKAEGIEFLLGGVGNAFERSGTGIRCRGGSASSSSSRSGGGGGTSASNRLSTYTRIAFGFKPALASLRWVGTCARVSQRADREGKRTRSRRGEHVSAHLEGAVLFREGLLEGHGGALPLLLVLLVLLLLLFLLFLLLCLVRSDSSMLVLPRGRRREG